MSRLILAGRVALGGGISEFLRKDSDLCRVMAARKKISGAHLPLEN